MSPFKILKKMTTLKKKFSSEDRAGMAFLQSIGLTIGMTIMPLVFWWTKEWKTFMILTTGPCVLFFICHKYLIESPRWLAVSIH